jgi:phosphoribosylformylglycinamidine synthase
MTPYEMMLSESQERMLMVLKPGREAEAEAIFRKWELDFAVIGHVTDTGHMILKFNGETVCDIPLGPLADEAPAYDRPWVPTPKRAALGPVPAKGSVPDNLLALLGTPDLASRRWIWEQYDHMVGADTLQRPGGDAAVVRVHGTKKGIAISTDCTPRYVFADPFEGGAQAIAECWRNITAVGATPLATTDCMNFGNPQRPEIMGQFVGAIEGMAKACAALDFPIVSGNVSLYNETKNDDGTGSAILPTPAIGGIGLLADVDTMATIAFKGNGEHIVLIGDEDGHLGQSLWLRYIAGKEEGAPPPVDLELEKRNGDFVRDLIQTGQVSAVHDVADGGLLVAIAEMALASGIGAHLDELDHARAFGEDQARYVVTTKNADAILAAALTAGVTARRLGTTGGDSVAGVGLAKLRSAHEGFFPSLMG